MSSLKIELEEAVLTSELHLLPFPPPLESPPTPPARDRSYRRAAALSFLSLISIGINGYHPYGEDAGIYVAGIKQAVHPGIFGTSAAFIAPYFRLSLFTNCNAWLIRALHLPIAYLLFTMQILTTWLLLYACWKLSTRCFRRPEERWASLLTVAICLSLPVAGSSLFMMDPYLTGRSFSTPLALLAIYACLEEKIPRAALLLVLVALFHPLMSIYATGFVLLLWAVKRESWTGVVGLATAAICAGEVIQYSQRTVVESAAYKAAAISRSYYFLYSWQWYELVGLAAPLILLTIYLRLRRLRPSEDGTALARTCILIGAISITVSLLYARPSSHSHLISALQTIRPFLFIYFSMFAILGGLLGRFLLHRSPWRWALFFVSAAIGVGILQHQAYPASAHVELPWVRSHNGWNLAFLWVRSHTAPDAIVAMDANYIDAAGENAQGFRAIAERASLADYSKDGGAAAAFPTLADRWMLEQTAATGLNQISDTERLRRLSSFHVNWIILNATATTALPCPFKDDLVKVCRLS